ncbi:hypothetical protein A3C73_01490 [Candidatus Giovannonibacteria bacterium RIFCSPHIGHO2_02_FULL_44_11]|nr:MAG: hypothetical protein A3C73_01490 [Candidatus Giovannonibacteria bacterium RIFCSPHIGHO2_02_FULL_44_11]
MPKLHNVAETRKDRKKFEYLYRTFENAAPKHKAFAEVEGLRREFAMVATSAWLRILRLSSLSSAHPLTKHLLPCDEDATQILASLTHFEMTERTVCNLLLKFKRGLLKNVSQVSLPFNMFITKKDSKYFLAQHKPE